MGGDWDDSGVYSFNINPRCPGTDVLRLGRRSWQYPIPTADGCSSLIITDYIRCSYAYVYSNCMLG